MFVSKYGIIFYSFTCIVFPLDNLLQKSLQISWCKRSITYFFFINRCIIRYKVCVVLLVSFPFRHMAVGHCLAHLWSIESSVQDPSGHRIPAGTAADGGCFSSLDPRTTKWSRVPYWLEMDMWLNKQPIFIAVSTVISELFIPHRHPA